MRAKQLFIDFDGVIRNWRGMADEFESIPTIEIQKTAFADELLGLAITGQITDEEWRRRIAERLAVNYGSVAFKAISTWSEPVGEIDQEVVSVLEGSRFRDNLVLITNATSRLRSDLNRLGLKNFFQFVVNSADIGIAKPASGIFVRALQKAGCRAEEAIFVDDKLENVESALGTGMRGHVFESAARLDDFLESN